MSKTEQATDRTEMQQLRQHEEAARIAAVKAKGAVPHSVGREVPEAPARGAFKVVQPMALYPKGDGEFERKPSGHMGRDRMEIADAFDVMEQQVKRAGGSFLLTPTQVAMGRLYRNVVERHDNAGIKCSSLETVGGGGGGSFIDALLRDRQTIEMLRCRIGQGSCMRVRRIRPSTRGSRRSIQDRRLVDAVCLEGKSVADVLAEHGWSKRGQSIQLVTRALAMALDRMIGPAGAVMIQSCGDVPGAKFGSRE